VINPERFQKIRKLLELRQSDLAMVMDNVNKPHNLAAIIRTCDAVGIETIHAVSQKPAIRTKQKTAGGSSKWTNLTLHDSMPVLLTTLRSEGKQILAAHFNEHSVDYRSIDYTKPTAIIMGAEKFGPAASTLEHVDQTIHIPMQGMVESLNVSVAAAVILFELQRQRLQAGCYDKPTLDPAYLQKRLFELSYPTISETLRHQGKPYPPLSEEGTSPFFTFSPGR